MAVQCTGSIAPGPGRIRDFRHRLVGVIHSRCAGVDVHKRRVVVCVITPEGRWTRTYGTTTGELMALAEWLTEQQVVDVAVALVSHSLRPRPARVAARRGLVANGW